MSPGWGTLIEVVQTLASLGPDQAKMGLKGLKERSRQNLRFCQGLFFGKPSLVEGFGRFLRKRTASFARSELPVAGSSSFSLRSRLKRAEMLDRGRFLRSLISR